jgi:hypothetical protein
MAAADADDGDTSRVIGERCGRMVGGVAGCVKKVEAFWFSLSLLFESE